jgi:hypothetical protein
MARVAAGDAHSTSIDHKRLGACGGRVQSE